MTNPEPPEGFSPHFRQSGLTDPWEPLYSKVSEEAILLGLWLRDVHCNSRGFVHGGLIASLADNAMGLSVVHFARSSGRDLSGAVTISLALDYVGTAQVGQWMEIETEYNKAGGSIAFAQAFIRADGEIIARADAKFRLLKG